MLKDRALQVKMVRQGEDAAPERASEWTPVAVSTLLQEQIQTVIITGTVAYIAKVTVDTISEILVKKTKKR